ncbi:MAG: hypothetical protein ACAH95_18335 [Fimbriimonas sp.]
MLLAAICATSIGLTAGDFFPLTEGRKSTYEEKSLTYSVTTDVVGKEEEIGRQKGIHVTTYQGAKDISHAFYRVDTDAVYLLAYAKENPLPTPMPLFKLGTKKTTWEFGGITGVKDGSEGMQIKGESELKGLKEVLGEKVEVLQVKITAEVGSGASKEIVEQQATYAKGIGLVELTSKTRIGKRSAESSLKLVKVESPGG